MPRVTVIQQIYNSRQWVPAVYDAIAAQTFRDFEVVAQVVADNGEAEDYIRNHYPSVKIVKPGYNIGFSKGHNEIFAHGDSDFFQLVNPDLILTPLFLERILQAFNDEKVASASGKLLQYDLTGKSRTNLLDSTGVVMFKSGSARDRGQHEPDKGQYDGQPDILGPSGAAAMYRRASLEAAKYPTPEGGFEYFDEDFFTYWEDVDLSLRLAAAGFTSRFIPEAVAYHGRTAGSNPGGYKKVFSFIRHHKQIPLPVRRLNYQNHIFTYVKNTPHWYPQFFLREFLYHIYLLLFEPKVYGAWPRFFRALPKMWKKRKYILKRRKITVARAEQLFS